MNTRKIQATLLFLALASSFLMVTYARPPVALCTICLYPENTNKAYDPTHGACVGVSLSPHQPGGGPLSSPFIGDDNGPTITAFRYVGFTDCDYCLLTAYSSSGKSMMISGTGGGETDNIGGTVKYSSVGFCANSLDLYCDATSSGGQVVEEEEEEEEE